MAGKMNWTGIERKLEEIRKFKADWEAELESGKSKASTELGDSYEGKAATATQEKMDDIKKKGAEFFDELERELTDKLAKQKAAWEEQERKSQQSVQ